MKIPSHKKILDAIENFLIKKKMSAHEFGKQYFNDSGFVPRLNAGSDLRLSTLIKIAKVIKGK